MSDGDYTPISFAGRVRTLMGQRGLTSVALAKLTGLSPSWLSRLVTENDDARRKAGIDDILALARGLEVTPTELAGGTDAETELGRWVPRESFDQELEARHTAQKEASDLRMRVAGLESQVALLSQELERMAKALVRSRDEEAKTKRAHLGLQLEVVAAQSSKRQAETERDQALLQARINYDAYVEAKQATTSTALFTGLVGVAGGLVLAETQRAPRRRRRPSA